MRTRAKTKEAIRRHAGGQTGILAIVCGLVPQEQMRPGEFTRFDIVVGLLMAAVSFATFSLDKAMLVGFAAYSLRPAIKGNGPINPYLVGSFLLLLLSVAVQFFFRG